MQTGIWSSGLNARRSSGLSARPRQPPRPLLRCDRGYSGPAASRTRHRTAAPPDGIDPAQRARSFGTTAGTRLMPTPAPRATVVTVLVVEDDEDTRQFLEDFLLLEGYQVLGAATGEAARPGCVPPDRRDPAGSPLTGCGWRRSLPRLPRRPGRCGPHHRHHGGPRARAGSHGARCRCDRFRAQTVSSRRPAHPAPAPHLSTRLAALLHRAGPSAAPGDEKRVATTPASCTGRVPRQHDPEAASGTLGTLDLNAPPVAFDDLLHHV